MTGALFNSWCMQLMNLSINQNQYQLKSINRLILEINEQSMRQNSILFINFYGFLKQVQ